MTEEEPQAVQVQQTKPIGRRLPECLKKFQFTKNDPRIKRTHEVRSLNANRALAISRVTHGRKIRDTWLLRAVTPTTLEAGLGITRESKVAMIKKLAPTLGATNVVDALSNYALTLVEIRSDLKTMEELYGKTAESDRDRIHAIKDGMWWKMKYAEKEWEFLSNVYGVGKPNFEIKAMREVSETTTATKVTLNQMMEKILGEIK